MFLDFTIRLNVCRMDGGFLLLARLVTISDKLSSPFQPYSWETFQLDIASPFLTLNYVIAIEGILPPRSQRELLESGGRELHYQDSSFLGEVRIFAGNL